MLIFVLLVVKTETGGNFLRVRKSRLHPTLYFFIDEKKNVTQRYEKPFDFPNKNQKSFQQLIVNNYNENK